MYNPLSAGRRHADRNALVGIVAVLLTALAILAVQQQLPAAWAALVGGLGVVVGSWIGARISLGGTVQGAGTAFFRLLVGLGTKWLIVVAAMLVGIAQGWPVLPLMIAVIVAILAPLIAEIINLRN